MRRPSWMIAVLLTSLAAAGCGGDEPAAVPFTIDLSPEFFQGAVPGAPTSLLVTIANESATELPVALTAVVEGASVTIEPSELRAGEVAEVTLVADPTAEERPLDIVVTGRRGDIERTAMRSTIVRPFENTEEAYAREILGLFTAWLAANEPGLGIGPETEFSASFVCPVLVVTHYLFLNETWEIGLSWHVMVRPDDWAEIYLRPREELDPTHAFRLRSQAEALLDGLVTIAPAMPPAEVTR